MLVLELELVLVLVLELVPGLVGEPPQPLPARSAGVVTAPVLELELELVLVLV